MDNIDEIYVYDLDSTLDTYLVSDDLLLIEKRGVANESNTYEIDISQEFKHRHQDEMQQNSDYEDEICPEWVKRQMKLGLLGEQIAEAYLKEHFSRVKNVTKDSWKGYDLEAYRDDECLHVEVKTSFESDKFNITYNELKIANKFKETYYIFFIKVYKNEKKVSGFLIKDPINSLDLPFGELSKIVEKNNVYISANKFIVEVKPNYLNEIEDEIISLTSYYQSE